MCLCVCFVCFCVFLCVFVFYCFFCVSFVVFFLCSRLSVQQPRPTDRQTTDRPSARPSVRSSVRATARESVCRTVRPREQPQARPTVTHVCRFRPPVEPPIQPTVRPSERHAHLFERPSVCPRNAPADFKQKSPRRVRLAEFCPPWLTRYVAVHFREHIHTKVSTEIEYPNRAKYSSRHSYTLMSTYSFTLISSSQHSCTAELVEPSRIQSFKHLSSCSYNLL